MGLRNAKIGKKLFILIFISNIIFVVIGGTGYFFMHKMDKDSNKMYEDALLPIKWQSQIRTNNRAIDGFVLESLLSSGAKERQESMDQIDVLKTENETLLNQLEESRLSEIELKKLSQYRAEDQKYFSIVQTVFNLGSSGQIEEAYSKYQNDAKPSRKSANTLMREVGDYLEGYADRLNKGITKDSQVSTVIMVAVIFIAIAIKVVIGLSISRMIINPLKEIQVLMGNAERGDLTVEGSYRSKDEVGLLTVSFNRMMLRFRELMGQVNSNAEQVAASSEELTASAEESTKASEQISITIQEVASGADRQVKSTEESSDVIGNMVLSVQQIASNAQGLFVNAEAASQKAVEGNEAIQSTIEQMNSINRTVTQLSQVVKGLGERSQDIGKIIEMITNIASQTNLLALNAAIESARAGEHGRGFAVVADEVRNLAEQSAESARNISELIALIQDETQFAVQTMEQTTLEVTEGIGVVNKAGESFAQIRNSVDEVSLQIKEVSEVAEQLSAGSEQVMQSEKLLAEIAEGTALGTQNAASAVEEQLASMEEILAAASSLAYMAEELQDQVGRFKV
ncbi:methyl-accepting chemotaxis protein [Domibacillus mangrovi]|uniref:Methyl-accepting chemotaxis protein n=1 Tax=Domibacillus mangrovi TaxID=1714354 RepID=A0A1Q5P5G3_9BACI|nr:methyl-accepting chemotaxis protein [Domibacillus mangrovi]OKL37510.1 hypothetical protein BLL40_04155 [Domibacillus mangrovi]